MVPTFYHLSRRFDQLVIQGVLLTYSELHDLYNVDMPRHWKDSPFYSLVAQLDREDIAAHRPLRTAILVLKAKDKKTVPGKAHYATYCKDQGIPFPRTAAEKRRVHANELAALRLYHRARSRLPGGILHTPPPTPPVPSGNPGAHGRI